MHLCSTIHELNSPRFNQLIHLKLHKILYYNDIWSKFVKEVKNVVKLDAAERNNNSNDNNNSNKEIQNQ